MLRPEVANQVQSIIIYVYYVTSSDAVARVSSGVQYLSSAFNPDSSRSTFQ